MTTRLTKRQIGGWHVHDGDCLIGWVVRDSDNVWRAFVRQRWGVLGRPVGWEYDRRADAVHEVEINREVWA